MTAGRIKPPRRMVEGVMNWEAREAEDRGLLPHCGHSMSMWHGCSGGMVGISGCDEATKQIQALIFGLSKQKYFLLPCIHYSPCLVKGGKSNTASKAFLALTHLPITWINAVIDSPALVPTRFRAEDFMSR